MPEVILNMPVSYYSGQRFANSPVHLNETFVSTVHSIKASRTQNRVRFIKDLLETSAQFLCARSQNMHLGLHKLHRAMKNQYVK